MPDRILVNEVGPRDGLQNQPIHVPLEDKLELIEALVAAGIRSIEATSFVSPKAVPQMADADQLFPRLPSPDRVRYSALVPNARGLDRALAAGVREVAVVLSATETMNRRNINMSLEEARRACTEVIAAAAARGARTRAYVAVAFTCPFEGPVARSHVVDLAHAMFDGGADEVVIADTIGAASPREVQDLLGESVTAFGADRLAAHLHDTRGFALANAWAALSVGIRRFDASIGGLGGCPFAPGAAGNLATEDLVVLADQCGFDTGISVPRLRAAVAIAERVTQRALGGRTTAWLRTQELKQQQYPSHESGVAPREAPDLAGQRAALARQ
jgi:hydroxymethylglutaryl-CoA lyase